MCVLRFGLLKARDEDMYEWLLQYIDHNQVRILNMIVGGGWRISQNWGNCKIGWKPVQNLYEVLTLRFAQIMAISNVKMGSLVTFWLGDLKLYESKNTFWSWRLEVIYEREDIFRYLNIQVREWPVSADQSRYSIRFYWRRVTWVFTAK